MSKELTVFLHAVKSQSTKKKRAINEFNQKVTPHNEVKWRLSVHLQNQSVFANLLDTNYLFFK